MYFMKCVLSMQDLVRALTKSSPVPHAADDANSELYGGWPMILSGLKTLLETGELLDTPGALA
jgi:hypothetical protein